MPDFYTATSLGWGDSGRYQGNIWGSLSLLPSQRLGSENLLRLGQKVITLSPNGVKK